MIKQLDNSQISKIMDIWLKANITAHNFIPETYWIRNYDVVKNEYIPISQTFVYEEDNELKGFISIINNSFVGALFVSEEYQGKGIGKKLLNYCKKLYSSLELCVYVDNIQAVIFAFNQISITLLICELSNCLIILYSFYIIFLI